MVVVVNRGVEMKNGSASRFVQQELLLLLLLILVVVMAVCWTLVVVVAAVASSLLTMTFFVTILFVHTTFSWVPMSDASYTRSRSCSLDGGGREADEDNEDGLNAPLLSQRTASRERSQSAGLPGVHQYDQEGGAKVGILQCCVKNECCTRPNTPVS